MAAARRLRRTGSESSETRQKLLDITARVMTKDGYAAVSSRRIAKDAEVTPGLVHYYFPTLDDLFLALLRRLAERNLERQARLLASSQPLRALWRFSSESSGAALLREFMALANHRKEVGKEIARYADLFRRTQLEALSDRLEEYDLGASDVPPVTLLVLINALSQALQQEQTLGVRTGVGETAALVERCLTRLEGPAEPKTDPRARRGRASSSKT